MKTPTQYIAPLRSRAAIVAWLLDRAESNLRKGYGLFCYNVKLHHLRTDFETAAENARKAGNLPEDSARWLADAKKLWDSEVDRAFEVATEWAAENVNDNDTNRMLWDGDRALAEWEFCGRSGGWLCLKEFDGVNLGAFEAAELFETAGFDWLRNLYRFLVQCDADFKRPESEVEYQAADYFFNNCVAGIKTDAQLAAEQAAEDKETAERAHWEARDTVTL